MPAETIVFLVAGAVIVLLLATSLFRDELRDISHRRQVRKLTRKPGKKIARRKKK